MVTEGATPPIVAPVMSTPDPSLPGNPAAPDSVPLLLEVTLFNVTTLAFVMTIPSPSWPVEVTLVRVTVGALSVAPWLLFPVPDVTLSVNAVSLTVIDPVPVVAARPWLFDPFPSKVLPFWMLMLPPVELRRAILAVPFA